MNDDQIDAALEHARAAYDAEIREIKNVVERSPYQAWLQGYLARERELLAPAAAPTPSQEPSPPEAGEADSEFERGYWKAISDVHLAAGLRRERTLPLEWLTRERWQPIIETVNTGAKAEQAQQAEGTRINVVTARPIAKDSWLQDRRHDWFRKAYSYASSKTNAISGLAKIHPTELYYVFRFMLRDLGAEVEDGKLVMLAVESSDGC